MVDQSAAAFLQGLRSVVGVDHVITMDADMAGYLADWRGRYSGRARAVVLPLDTAQVAAVVRLCASAGVPLVPQGGRTGLVMGSVPDLSGSAIVLSLRRLNRIRAIDPANRTMTVEAFKDSPLPDGFFRTVNPAHIDAYHQAVARELA